MDITVDYGDLATTLRLQWGHAFSGMDTQRLADAAAERNRASMGPCPFRHGYLSSRAMMMMALKLQWGHALSGMDISVLLVFGDFLQKLQWGHALSGMDILILCMPFFTMSVLQWGHALSGMDI